MKITASCDYACKALLELAIHWPGKKPIQVHEIAGRNGIPLKFLGQILSQLKRIGLVKSMRGKTGGYMLSCAPNKITLNDVIREISGPFLPLVENEAKRNPVFTKIWQEVDSAMSNILDKITFEDIVNQVENAKKTLLYQI